MSEARPRSVTVRVLRLPHGQGLALPSYQSKHAAGLDVVAAVIEPVELAPEGRMLVPTGFALELPEGYEAQVRPRSGLALKHGVTLLNTPGVRLEPGARMIGQSAGQLYLENAGQILAVEKP